MAISNQIIFLLLIIQLLTRCSQSSNCQIDDENFQSYREAADFVGSYDFIIEEKIDATNSSSWIESIEYLSCNEGSGYLLLQVGGKEYIHTGVPYNLWLEL